MTAPTVTIRTTTDPVTVTKSATFTFSADEPGVTYECALHGQGVTYDYSECTSPRTYPKAGAIPAEALLATGEQRFFVRATDASLNIGEPAEYVWYVESPPVERNVFCGQVLTQSVIVQNDLADCLYDGLVVGKAGITIDLNGHIVDGKGIGAGIRNDGFDNVTIRGGDIKEFDYGVMLNQGTTGNIVEHLTIEKSEEAAVMLGNPAPVDPALPQPPPPTSNYDSNVDGNTVRFVDLLINDIGVWITNRAADNLVRDNRFAANSKHGVFLERVSGNRIDRNEIISTAGEGITIEGASDNVVSNNFLEDNSGGGIGLALTSSGVPGNVGLPSNNNLIEGNSLYESGGSGIAVEGSSITLLVGNKLIDNRSHFSNGDGIELDYARDMLVKGNDVTDNKGGISLKGATHSRIEGNIANESDGDGIGLEGLSLNNELIGNEASHNLGDGIYVGDESSGSSGILIEDNETHDNKGYGIVVTKVSHIIKNNTANDNDSWGIWVSDGSNGRVNIDGGTNKAQGNVGAIDPITQKPLQCYGVQCVYGLPVNADQIPPETLLIQAPGMDEPLHKTTDPVAEFRFTGSDNASTVEFQCRRDYPATSPQAQGWVACTSPMNYGALIPGAHKFEVRALDVTGNVDESPVKYEWFIMPLPSDVPPVTTLESHPPEITVETGAAFTFSSNEYGSTFRCRLDKIVGTTTEFGTTAVCSTPKTYANLEVGKYRFNVQAKDVEGNYADAWATWTWTVSAPPVPREVSCGEIVIQSIVVQNDLIDCIGNGLIVGTRDITIDLDGHVIDGTGIDTGILNNGFDNVTITNGLVTEFDYGVLLNPGSSKNTITGLRLELNQEAAIGLADADQSVNGTVYGNTVQGNTLVENGIGIALYSNTRRQLITENSVGGSLKEGIVLEQANENTITNNQIATAGGHAIWMQASSDNIVTGNDLNSNLDGIAVGEELLPSNRNLIESNRIVDGLGTGVSVIDSVDNQILYNEVRDAQGGGIMLDLARNTLIRGNDLAGSKDGISLGESSNNIIESNNASGTLGTGIEIGSLSVGNKVLNNTASTNSGDGITVEGAAPLNQGTMIDGNTADGNGGDGISSEGVGHTIKNNTVRFNGGYGIYAIGASPASANNFAAGNLEVPQCIGVICEIGPAPGAPEVWITDGPVGPPPAALPAPGVSFGTSNSQFASFTYNAKDNVDQIIDIVFECRLDTTDDLMWEDCEYPQEYINLSPGQHTFQIRAIDKQLMASEPVSYTWTYTALPSGVRPVTTITMGAGDVNANGDLIVGPDGYPMTWLPEAIFTYEANEPDVLFECAVDFPLFPYEPCTLQEGLIPANYGGWEVALEENQFGLHTFYVRATDAEGNVGLPAEYTWRLLGIDTIFTAGPGFTPGETPFEPNTGGPSYEQDCDDRLRGEHRRRDLRVLARPRRVRALHPARHLHGPDHRRPQPARARDRHGARRRRDRAEEAAEYEWSVEAAANNARPKRSSSACRRTTRRRRCSSSRARTTSPRRAFSSSSAGSTTSARRRTSWRAGGSASAPSTCSTTTGSSAAATRSRIPRWRPAGRSSRCAPSTTPSRSIRARRRRGTSTSRRPAGSGRWWPTPWSRAPASSAAPRTTPGSDWSSPSSSSSAATTRPRCSS